MTYDVRRTTHVLSHQLQGAKGASLFANPAILRWVHAAFTTFPRDDPHPPVNYLQDRGHITGDNNARPKHHRTLALIANGDTIPATAAFLLLNEETCFFHGRITAEIPVEKIEGGSILLREQVGTVLRPLFPADEGKGKGKTGEKPTLFTVSAGQILKYLQWLQFILLGHGNYSESRIQEPGARIEER